MTQERIRIRLLTITGHLSLISLDNQIVQDNRLQDKIRSHIIIDNQIVQDNLIVEEIRSHIITDNQIVQDNQTHQEVLSL